MEGLRACLETHNAKEAGVQPDSRSLAWVVRQDNERLIGGLAAEARYGWLHIRLLWINPDARQGGAGRALITAAERYARSAELVGLLTDTSSFQAPAFYTRCGFEIVGQIADLPPGHTTYYLKKRLVPGPDASP